MTPAELSSFLHLCQRTQLDPFSRQIYLIGRWDNRENRKVFTPQTGIDGYRVIAHRVTAQSGGTYGYEDTLWCDEAGRWRDVWLSDKPPAAAKVTVIRNGQPFSAVALFREYVQTNRDGKPTGLWGKMQSGQIAKCAEALALRKAFPLDLAGVYTAEEMAQAESEASAHTAPPVEQRVTVVRSTPAGPPPEPAAPPRDFLAEALAAATADDVVVIYRAAEAAGAPADYLGQLRELGAAMRAAEQPTYGATPATIAAHERAVAAANASATPPAADEEHPVVLAEMYAAAGDAGLNPAEADQAFTAAHGCTPAVATVEQLRSQRDDLLAAIQQGAQA